MQGAGAAGGGARPLNGARALQLPALQVLRAGGDRFRTPQTAAQRVKGRRRMAQWHGGLCLKPPGLCGAPAAAQGGLRDVRCEA